MRYARTSDEEKPFIRVLDEFDSRSGTKIKIMKYIKIIISKFFKPYDPHGAYLSQATDVCDLERRMKDIQKGKFRDLPYL